MKMKRITLALGLFLLCFAVTQNAHAIAIGGAAWSYEFADSTFFDSIIDSQGGKFSSDGTSAGLLNDNGIDEMIKVIDIDGVTPGETDLGATGDPNTSGPSVPEPATLLLLGAGLIGLARFGRKFTA